MSMDVIDYDILGDDMQYVEIELAPGEAVMGDLPFSRRANHIIASAPPMGGKQVGEDSVLGGLGGLLDGDNRSSGHAVTKTSSAPLTLRRLISRRV